MGDVMSLDQLDKVKAEIDALNVKVDSLEILMQKLNKTQFPTMGSLSTRSYYIYVSNQDNETYQELVNVSGQGCLRYAVINSSARSAAYNVGRSQIEITIDGQTVISSSRDGTSERYSGGILARNHVAGFDDNNIGMYMDDGNNVEFTGGKWAYAFTELSKYNFSKAINSVLLVDYPIQFDNQLVIKTKSNVSSTVGGYDAFVKYDIY